MTKPSLPAVSAFRGRFFKIFLETYSGFSNMLCFTGLTCIPVHKNAFYDTFGFISIPRLSSQNIGIRFYHFGNVHLTIYGRLETNDNALCMLF